MKLTFLLLIMGVLQLTASVHAQNGKLNVQAENMQLSDLLWQLQEESGLVFIYQTDDLTNVPAITYEKSNATITEILDDIFEDTDLDYILNNDVVVIKKKEAEPTVIKSKQEKQEKKELKGTVTDENGETLPGVSVVIKGTTYGVSTDIDGNYTLLMPEMGGILVFSFVGMKAREVAYTGQKQVDVILKADSESLNEVIVTGYQNIDKARMTGAVAVMNAQDIKEIGAVSMDQALQGLTAGVTVQNLSGRPGESSVIRIRGLNSITGNMNPIWVVDGMEMQDAVPSISTGGADLETDVFTNGIGNISPDDIRSITILKDAAATALYGARAANGVIVVTTKSGTAGEASINFSSSYSISEAPRNNLDIMNSAEKVAYEQSIYEDFPGLDINSSAYRIYKDMDLGAISSEKGNGMLEQLRNTNTDWFKEIFRTAKSQNHNFSMSGGNDQLHYYTSFSYKKDEGILKGNELNSLSGNINLTYKPNKKVKVDARIRTSIRNDKYPNTMVDPFKYATYANPYEKVYNEDGSYAYDRSYNQLNINKINPYTDEYWHDYNIIEDLNEGGKKSRATSTTLQGKLTWDIGKGLSYETNVAYTYSSDQREAWGEPGSPNSYSKLWISQVSELYLKDYNNGYLSESAGSNNSWSAKNILKYNKSFDKHFINILAGQEISQRNIRNIGSLLPEYNPDLKLGGFPEDLPLDYDDLVQAINKLSSSSRDESKSSSFFGTASYSYDDKYVVSGSIRYDGVDIIGNSNQFTPLWNISSKWNSHKENFMSGLDWINILSFRFSYGFTGSIDRSALPFSTIKYGSSTNYDGYIYPKNVNWANPNIKWQTKTDRSLGTDFSFFKNRVSGEFNYYNNEIKDLLDYQRLPVSSGQSGVRANVASLENKGYELNLNVVMYSKGDFRWTTKFNIAQNNNKVLENYNKSLSGLEDVNEKAIIMTKYNSKTKQYIEGYDVSSWFGYKFAGVDPVTGNSLAYVQDISKVNEWEIHSYKNGKAIIDMDENFNNEAALSYLGVQHPEISGGFGTSFRYKNLSLSTNFTFLKGHKIKSPKSTSSSIASLSEVNSLRESLNRWRQPGDETNIGKYSQDYNNAYTYYFFDTDLEDGDFLKWSNLTLSYRLPTKLARKLNLKRCKLAFIANNLKTWTKYKGIDPETNGAFRYPSARRYTLSVSLGL